MNSAKCIEANRDSQRIVGMLEKAHSIIFGDMDTLESDDSDVETRDRSNQSQAKRRQRFMEQLLQQVDNTDDNVLTLDQSWFRSYWIRFKQYIGYCSEKFFGTSSELSKRYRLAAALKNEIPVTIYYESCVICLDLILEIWNTEPKVCVTKCGHIFHYDCLKEWFTEKKICPNCRTDLRSLPERMLGLRIGLHPINEQLKSPSVVVPITQPVPSPTTSSVDPPMVPPTDPSTAPTADPPTACLVTSLRPPTPISGEVEELISLEEANNINASQ